MTGIATAIDHGRSVLNSLRFTVRFRSAAEKGFCGKAKSPSYIEGAEATECCHPDPPEGFVTRWDIDAGEHFCLKKDNEQEAQY